MKLRQAQSCKYRIWVRYFKPMRLNDLSRLMHGFSPATWLAVVFASLVVAVSAGAILLARSDHPQNRLPGKVFDTVEQFARDTMRLTFSERMEVDTSDAVFVAPRGILNEKATFNWVELRSLDARQEAALPTLVAPARLLDADWTPAFSGLPSNSKRP